MRVLSLFSGIGGLDLAAEWAGMTTVAFCERDPYCQKVLAKHWPGVPIFDDVTTLCRRIWMNKPQEDDYVECSIHAGEDFGDCACIGTDQFLDEHGAVDIVIGGYPCQPFSVAGKRKGKDDERYLWPEFMRIVRELGPTWVVGENVGGHVTNGLDAVCDDLEAEGYAVQPFVFPASAVGANHNRERCFVVAYSAQLFRDGGDSQSKREVPEFGNGGSAADVADTSGAGLQEFNTPNFAAKSGHSARSLAERWDNWSVEPAVGRVVDGTANRVDRLRALGNAVVPQQAYPIFKAIAEVSR